MPRNLKGGNKAKKGKNAPPEERKLVLRQEGLEYARVIKRLGGAPPLIEARVQGRNGAPDRTMTCVVRTKQGRRKVWLNKDDLILVSMRDFQSDRADAVHKYKEAEKWKLIRRGEVRPNDDEELPPEPVEPVTKKKSKAPSNSKSGYYFPEDMLPPSDDEEDYYVEKEVSKPSQDWSVLSSKLLWTGYRELKNNGKLTIGDCQACIDCLDTFIINLTNLKPTDDEKDIQVLEKHKLQIEESLNKLEVEQAKLNLKEDKEKSYNKKSQFNKQDANDDDDSASIDLMDL